MGLNVLANVLQQACQALLSKDDADQAQRLGDLAHALTQGIEAQPQVRQEVGTFLINMDAFTVLGEVATEDSNAHRWLLAKIQEDIARYRSDFDRIHQTLEEIRRLVEQMAVSAEGSQENADTDATGDTALCHDLIHDRTVTWVAEARQGWETVLSEEMSKGRPDPYPHGSWSIAYAIQGTTERLSLTALLGILRDIEGTEPGIPWFLPDDQRFAPFPKGGRIVCWRPDYEQPDPSRSVFWMAGAEGLMFAMRGYPEDSGRRKTVPGTVFDIVLPVWRVGACVLHARRLATALARGDASIAFRIDWTGLNGRMLTGWSDPERTPWTPMQCRDDSAVAEAAATVASIGEALPEVVSVLTGPLYERFDFFEPSMEMISAELTGLRGAAGAR